MSYDFTYTWNLNNKIGLARWLSWLEHHPVHQKFADLSPGKATH